jgi:hypothetical protein
MPANEGARHGKQGVEPAREEAELVVNLSASVVTYLNRKHKHIRLIDLQGEAVTPNRPAFLP